MIIEAQRFLTLFNFYYFSFKLFIFDKKKKERKIKNRKPKIKYSLHAKIELHQTQFTVSNSRLFTSKFYIFLLLIIFLSNRFTSVFYLIMEKKKIEISRKKIQRKIF